MLACVWLICISIECLHTQVYCNFLGSSETDSKINSDICSCSQIFVSGSN